MTLQQALDLAQQHQRAGQAAQAQSIYQQILTVDARNIAALQLLARLYYETGQHPLAAEMLQRAITVDPNNPDFYSNLGSVLAGLGRVDDAVAAVRKAITLRPHSPETHGNLGNVLLAKGEITEAILAYRQALALKPAAPELMSNLGNALRKKGDLAGAIESYRRAVELRPDFIEAQINLGHALKEANRPTEAEDAYRRAIKARPQNPDGFIGLGHVLQETDRLDEALAAYRQALAFRSDAAEAWYGIGMAFKKKLDIDPAIDAFRNAVRIRPTYADAYSSLGIALYEKGAVDESIAAYQEAITHNPQYAEAHNNLGITLHAAGRMSEAVAALKHALSIRPNYAEALNNIGLAYEELGNPDEALASYRRAVAIKPDFAYGQNNLANCLKDTGRLDDAIAIYRSAADSSNHPWLLGNLLFALHAHPDYGPKELWEEHRKWGERFAKPLASSLAHSNDRSPERRLKIGYVSPDFNEHPVGRFLLPLMLNHDHSKFEIFCYSDGRRKDWVAEALESAANVWRRTLGTSDEQMAELIRKDQIDILIDLTMHTKDSRLTVFARKPAPVQATYLAYCSTTGVDAIDYRLTDPFLDPPPEGSTPTPESSDAFYTEKSVRLPHTYWCYRAPPEAGEVGPSPVAQFGSITFGCLNSFSKVTPVAIATWGRILGSVSGSRLVLYCREGSHRHRVTELFQQAGVEPHRIQFSPRVSGEDYFKLYNQIDIALDPFPYPGGTTTCDALWMGVPVITLKGRTAVSRGGFSILSNIGLAELVGHSLDQYVQAAIELVADRARLIDLRTSLRSRMLISPLMDAPRFARDFEDALRMMWRAYCGHSK